jgi:FecR protein
MKSIVKSILLILAGALVAGALLYGYSIFIESAGTVDESLSFVEIEPGDAVISHISGEVYLIREEKILSPRPGDAVREGDVIKVVDDSWCQVHFVGKATMSLRSNTLIKIQKLLTSTKDIDVRTELLTGSMIYKVDRLSATDNLEVQAQEKIYRVEGTEFYIEAFAGGSRVSVQEGTVAVLQDTGDEERLLKTVPAGQSLNLKQWKQGTALPEIEDISSSDIRIFKEESPVLFDMNEKSLVYLEIRTLPEGAQLYLDGRLNSRGNLTGLFAPDETLSILARKRGYRDINMKLLPGEQSSSDVILKMEPLGLEESLKEESENPQTESLEELKARFETESEALTGNFTKQIRESEVHLEEMKSLSLILQNNIDNLKGSNSELSDEKIELEEKLEKSLTEQEKLKQLLLQIQELSTDQ